MTLTAAMFIVGILLIVFDFYFARKAFAQREDYSKYLGISALFAGVITMAYLCSVRDRGYLNMSIASSIYFACIDWMLVSLVHFIYRVTGLNKTTYSDLIRKIFIACAGVDSFIMGANITWEIAVGYEVLEEPVHHVVYHMKPLGISHLIFTYIMVLFILALLVHKILHTPRQYRNQFSLFLWALIAVVAINAMFLYPTSNEMFTVYDYSLACYSLALYLIYWAAFDYKSGTMLKQLSMTIFEKVDLGIVLFDYGDELIMKNERADEMLASVDIKSVKTRPQFLEKCRIPERMKDTAQYSLQSEIMGKNGAPLRCDYQTLQNDRGDLAGHLFVFTDSSNDRDILTGFRHAEDFPRRCIERPSDFDHPTTAVMFDIVGLGEINRTFGREIGDRRIRTLSQSIRENMPKGSYFIRGYEAHLVVVCPGSEERDIIAGVEKIIESTAGTVFFGIATTSDGTETVSHGIADGESRNVIGAIEAAGRSLAVKKLLSAKSQHSQQLASLVRALQESDSDTESHVRRTQLMGDELGKRIGLNDSQRADLKLLCLLHDIGKIGIPLEILNKPGRLTDEERTVLRTHTEKGYQIALSNGDLRSIARLILSHHEQWDGKGYPNHLAGTDIPILSRLIAVVDSYDAMVNDRAYRKGMEPEQAMDEIRRCAGSQFDPFLAGEFIKMLEEDPDLAQAEKTGAEEIRVFTMANEGVHDVSGNTVPVRYTRYLLDLNDTVIETDERFPDITGYARAEADGRLNQLELIPPEDRAYYMVQVNEAFTHGDIAFLRHDILRRDGKRVRVMCYGKRYFDSAAKAYRSEIILTECPSSHSHHQNSLFENH